MIELVLLATTDLHTNLRAYDYYKDAPVDHYGMAKIATLVAEERKRSPGALLVDAGDFFQGTPLGDVYGKGTPTPSRKRHHPVASAFRALKYDAIAIGNHEFDYGLSTLRAALGGLGAPYTSANVTAKDPKGVKFDNLAAQSVTVVREIAGTQVTTCLFGLTPPQILTWNKAKLGGLVRVEDPLAAATRTAKRLREKGCDVVVAIVHGGLNPLPYELNEENPAWHVAGLPDVDAVVAGHAHQEFPSAKFEGLKEADLAKGTVRGKPVVMAGQWGAQLGIITLQLEKSGGRLRIVGGKSALRATKGIAEDAAFVKQVESAHAATLAAVRAPVGEIRQPIDTYFSRIRSTAAVDIVNAAQTWHVEKAVAGGPLAKWPILSAAAPFKAGFKGEFTVIPKGTVAVKNVADLYVYPNTLQAVTLTGAQVKDWLEKSAEAFTEIKPGDTSDRPLLDDDFPTYNFDVLSGVTYEIDVSRPKGARIEDFAHAGKPVDPAATFLVATNNYRAGGGGKFPHLGSGAIAYDAARENREVLFDYLREKKIVDAAPANAWKLKRLEGVKGRVWIDVSAAAPVPAYLAPWPGDAPAGLQPGFKRYVIDLAALH